MVEKKTPKKVAATEAPRSWGPFTKYTFVTTEEGEFGVPHSHILTLEPTKTFNVKENVWKDSMKPRLEYVDMVDA